MTIVFNSVNTILYTIHMSLLMLCFQTHHSTFFSQNPYSDRDGADENEAGGAACPRPASTQTPSAQMEGVWKIGVSGKRLLFTSMFQNLLIDFL